MTLSSKRTGHLIVTIDGPAGAGKSTVAKGLAKQLGLSYLDTGAMYRALTLKALAKKVSLEDEQALVNLARHTDIDLEGSAEQLKVILDGKDVSEAIRTPDVTNKTYHISQAPRVREIMVEWQRAMGKRKGIVIEGRDTGTVVFPSASFKFYLDADLNVRSTRRTKELQEKGQSVDAAKMKEDIKTRDHKDMTREASPLKKADDAVFIDTTHLTIEQTVERILEHIKAHG